MSKGEKTRMNVTLSSCFVLPFFRICNPKAIILWILNPHDKASGLQIPKDEYYRSRGDRLWSPVYKRAGTSHCPYLCDTVLLDL